MKPKTNLFDDLSEEDLAKIDALKEASTNKVSVDQEWMLLAEFAKTFGWEAYKDAKNDVISSGEMMTLILAARKLKNIDTYNAAYAALVGAGASKSKSPSSAFRKMTRVILNNAKADE